MRQTSFMRTLTLIGATLALTACSSPAPEGTLIITNANVIIGDGSDILKNQAVMIDGQTILSIQNMSYLKASGNMEIIDAQNAYLLPGFIDTHAHVGIGPIGFDMSGDIPVPTSSPSDQIADQTLKTMLEYGVTTARDPGGASHVTLPAKQRLQTGEIDGPDLWVAGDIIDTDTFKNLAATVKTPADVRVEVARQAEAGVDWIKLYTGLSKDMVAAGIDEAHSRGVKVTGHFQSTNWTQASELGIDSIVHIIPGSPELLPNDKQSEYEDSMLKATFILKWFELADFSSPEITEMITALRENKVSIDPTLVIFHAMAFGDDDAYLKNPALEQVSPELVENWRTFFNFNLGWTAADFEYAQATWPRVEEFTRLLHSSGVHLTVAPMPIIRGLFLVIVFIPNWSFWSRPEF